MKKKILLLIPVRLGSSRFPGKPLKKIQNSVPMVEYIYKNIKNSKIIEDVYVATCDKKIHEFILQKVKGKSVMTSKSHQRATDRCAEALIKIEKKQKKKYDIVIMLQGDEPLITKKMVEKGVKPLLKNNKVLVSNLVCEISSKKELEDQNCIKVVFDNDNNALYYSRSSIPYKKHQKKYAYKQVCSIAFQKTFLQKYIKLQPTKLEKLESIDMLRILEHGFKIKLVKVRGNIQSVDTYADLKKVNFILNNK